MKHRFGHHDQTNSWFILVVNLNGDRPCSPIIIVRFHLFDPYHTMKIASSQHPGQAEKAYYCASHKYVHKTFAQPNIYHKRRPDIQQAYVCIHTERV